MGSLDHLSIHYCPLKETNAHGNIKRKNVTWWISTLEKVHSLYSLIKDKILNTSIVSALQILILQIVSNDTVTVHRWWWPGENSSSLQRLWVYELTSIFYYKHTVAHGTSITASLKSILLVSFPRSKHTNNTKYKAYYCPLKKEVSK